MNGLPPEAAGWYGKLPSLGDFASRRLPVDFIEPWDAWLSSVLEASRRRLGNDWLNAYLSCPVWRFLLLPGALSANGWAGVLLASVDRVGRHFPLTVAAPMDKPPATPAALAAFWHWLSALERCALDAIEYDHDAAAFDAALAGVVAPLPAPAASSPIPWRALADGRSLWTAFPVGPDQPFDLHAAAGMPDPAAFAVMLTGR
ncbi:hypothetical protein GCM10023144_24970 [Pigmentiphaga soli]|uniref:Type VI secretion system-associated protein TagF n=1 Tax=Pigmentiphaga soli TaxID=1007095 RepID=A0ABP8H2P4_9BURK